MYGAGNSTAVGNKSTETAYELQGGDDTAGQPNYPSAGLVGDDFIKGNAGSDTIYGGLGSDWIKGGSDADYLYGGLMVMM